ncbi:hypothetical protein Bpfe_022030 [Biomphalaria pfeifferi]|uniref:Uncharacterized protein n=1 Tax=Biomphalaria pfeifferi TaxID=112525 RepID=A0AAD8F1S8_BIOPF|nr:hypothetical protein Bpfe_022030 [Biomphalaria pfeifferi]
MVPDLLGTSAKPNGQFKESFLRSEYHLLRPPSPGSVENSGKQPGRCNPKSRGHGRGDSAMVAECGVGKIP